MELEQLRQSLVSGELLKRGERVLVAVSGGADSVALLALLAECAEAAGYAVEAAHFHHGIRAESDNEMEFVKDLCRRFDVPCHCARENVPAFASEHRMSIETAARKLRYEFLNRTADEVSATRIALAHHRRDQVETVLMHLFRGSSIQGLSGMRYLSGKLFRPLLDVDPGDLRAYLADRGISFCEDPSNADTRYTRNFIRHELLPVCRQAYPGCERALAQLARSAQVEDDLMQKLTQQALSACLAIYPGGMYIKKVPFGKLHLALQLRVAANIMRRLDLDPEYMALERILAAENGQASTLAANITVSSGRSRIYIERASAIEASSKRSIAVDATAPDSIDTPWGLLTIRPGRVSDYGDGLTRQAMDADALVGAVMRTRHGGEVISPLGMDGSKRLKEYWIDKEVDRQIRAYMPVLANGSEVLWSPGVGVSRRAAITPDTRRTVTLELNGFGLWPDKADASDSPLFLKLN